VAWQQQPNPQGPTSGATPRPVRLTPLTLADVLDGMFRLVSSNWRVYLIALGSLIIPFNILNGVLSIGGTGMIDMYAGLIESSASGAPPPPPPQPTAGSLGMMMASGLVGMVSFFFVTPVTWGLSTTIAAMAYQGWSPQPREVWRATMRKFGPLIALELLVALIAGAAAVILVILVMMGAATGSVVFGIVLALVGLCGGLWLMVRLSLCVPAVIAENAGPGQALGRSWALTSGRQFWRTLVAWLVAGLILIVLTLVFTAGFAAAGSMAGTRGAIAAGFIGWTIVGIFTTPLFLNAALLLYYDARIRTEAFDLEVMTHHVITTSYLAPGRAPLA
jgi:hypothetical protein